MQKNKIMKKRAVIYNDPVDRATHDAPLKKKKRKFDDAEKDCKYKGAKRRTKMKY